MDTSDEWIRERTGIRERRFVLQHQLGVGPVGAMDLRTQCTGFVYALATAYAYMRSGMYRRIPPPGPRPRALRPKARFRRFPLHRAGADPDRGHRPVHERTRGLPKRGAQVPGGHSGGARATGRWRRSDPGTRSRRGQNDTGWGRVTILKGCGQQPATPFNLEGYDGRDRVASGTLNLDPGD